MSTDLATMVHPYAGKFPMLSGDDLAELTESIRTNGLRSPVVLTPDGLILDGRNRWAACEQAGVTPETVVYDGNDLAEYVIDANITRRNMSTGARAMATAMVLEAAGRRENGRWVGWSRTFQDSGKSSGEREALRCAGVVLDFAPDLAEQVVNGALALDAAHRQAVDRRDAERNKLAEAERLAAEEADARTFIEDHAPDLAEQVGDTGPFRSFVEALDVWNRRNAEEAARIKTEKQQAAKREADERNARSQLYSGIARGLQICGGYGQYQDIPKLMAEFDPRELNPPQYDREFHPDNLRSAARFAIELLEWVEAQQ